MAGLLGLAAALNRRLEGLLWPLVLVSTAAGLLLQELAGSLTGVLPYVLIYNITVTSLQCTYAQIVELRHKLRLLVAPLAVLYVLLPVAAYGLGRVLLGAHPEMGLGLLLNHLTPSGITGGVWTALAAGNVSLSIAVVTLTNLLSVALIPVVFGWAAGMAVAVDAGRLLDNLVRTVLVPAALGVAINSRWQAALQQVRAPLALGVKLAILTFTFVTAGRLRLAHASGPQVALTVLAVAALVALAYGAGTLAAGRAGGFPRGDRIAVVYACGTRNHLVGLSIASLFLPPAALVPLLISNLFNHPTASLVHRALQGGRWLAPAQPVAELLPRPRPGTPPGPPPEARAPGVAWRRGRP